jgi:putative ABC transport system permease protein
MVYGQLPQTLPEVAMTAEVAGRTVLIAVVLGVAAVALAPLVTARRLARMDVPGTLRLVE